MSDEDSADEIDEDCKLLNGDVKWAWGALGAGGAADLNSQLKPWCRREVAGTEGQGADSEGDLQSCQAAGHPPAQPSTQGTNPEFPASGCRLFSESRWDQGQCWEAEESTRALSSRGAGGGGGGDSLISFFPLLGTAKVLFLPEGPSDGKIILLLANCFRKP